MAVYTEVTAEELDALLERYDIGGLTSCKGIAEGVENCNFLLVTGRGQFILTLYEKRVAPGGPAVLPRPDGASGGPRHDAARRRCTAATAESLRPARAAGRPRSSPSSTACGSRRADRRALRGAGRRRWRGLHLAGPTSRCGARTRFRSPAGGQLSTRHAASAPTRCRRDWPNVSPRELDALRARLAARPAAGRHPRRPVSRTMSSFSATSYPALIDFYFACTDTSLTTSPSA